MSERAADGERTEIAVLLGGTLSPVGWSVGFVEAPWEATRDRLLAWRRRLGTDLHVRDDVGAWPGCLAALAPLEAPWTTELIVEHRPGWTAYLNNDLNGGDPWPATSQIGDELGVRWVGATHQPKTPVGHASTQFWLGGPAGQPPLRYIRTIAAHCEDGRWSWHTSGEPLPFERIEAYEARLVRNRLTRAMLVDYLDAVGIAVDTADRFGRAILIRQRISWHTRKQTVEQARAAWKL